MTKLCCARCMTEMAAHSSRSLAGIVGTSLCWRCSHPAFHGGVATA